MRNCELLFARRKVPQQCHACHHRQLKRFSHGMHDVGLQKRWSTQRHKSKGPSVPKTCKQADINGCESSGNEKQMKGSDVGHLLWQHVIVMRGHFGTWVEPGTRPWHHGEKLDVNMKEWVKCFGTLSTVLVNSIWRFITRQWLVTSPDVDAQLPDLEVEVNVSNWT